jgi:hypothetical protein
MKVVFSLMVLFGLTLAAQQSAARHYKAWSVAQEQGRLFMSTNGYFSKSRRLALALDSTCGNVTLRLLWDTYDPNVREYLHAGQQVNFTVAVDSGEGMRMPLQLLSVKDTTEGIELLFGQDDVSEGLMGLFKRGYEVRFEITGSRGLIKTFDLKSDYFSLDGFTAALHDLDKHCKKE